MMNINDTDGLFTLDVEAGGRERSQFAILPRPKNNPDYIRYTAPGAAGVVYIHRAAWLEMRSIALRAGRNEAIAILLGRPCSDEDGNYTLVMAVEAALPGEYIGSSGSVKISAAGKAALKQRAAQNHAGWEDVGWFHTHPFGEPRFSPTDNDEQATRLEHQVGIVAASQYYHGHRGDPLGVYLGPAGHRLRGSVPAPQVERQSPTPVEEPSAAVERRSRPTRAEIPKRLPMGSVAVALILLTQLGLASWVRGAIRTRQTVTVVTQTRRVVRQVPGPFVAQQCVAGGQVSVPVPVPPAVARDVDLTVVNSAVAAARYMATSRNVTVTCLSPGTTTIELHDPSSHATADLVVTVFRINHLQVNP
jgi:hypothetical protein